MKKDFLFNETENLYLSYQKLSGKKIKDIVGYVSTELGDVAFKLSKVIFEDGTEQYVEGEHDFPYMTDDSDETTKRMEEIDAEKSRELEEENRRLSGLGG